MELLRAPDPMAKFRLARVDKDFYNLCIGRHYFMSLARYNEFVSRARPSTYDQILIGEVLEMLEEISEFHGTRSPRPHILSIKVYDDLKSTFRRSRKAGEAKALALAKKLYLDEFNRMVQTSTWVKVGSSSGVLEIKLKGKNYCYSLRFRDGVDSISVKCIPTLPVDLFGLFWYFKARRIKELISLLSTFELEFASSIQGVEEETLLKALELALHHNTTLGAALFLAARE